MSAVFELLLRLAVTTALWLLVMVEALVALNVEVVAPADTVTDAGTVSKLLLLLSVTVDPPAGAVSVRVTVQVLEELWARLAGLHARLETSTGASRLIAAVCELLPSVAVTVAL